jgi:genome maintenance exonuclease 1
MFIHSSSFTPIELEAVMVDGRRLYPTPSGGKYPSITTVLGMCPKKKASLSKWKLRVGQEKAQAISTRAATRGTNFHSIVENYLNNCYNEKEHKSSPLPLLMFKNAVPILNRINKVYLQEAALYSDHLEIAGRVDCIGEFDSIPSVIDFKTSAEEKKEEWMEDYYIQETGYGCMFYELYKTRIKQLVTIVACEDGNTQVVIKTPKKEYLERLIYLRSLYEEKYGG